MENRLARLGVGWDGRWPVACGRLEISPSCRLCWKSSVSRKFCPLATTPLSIRMAYTFSHPAQQKVASPEGKAQRVHVMTRVQPLPHDRGSERIIWGLAFLVST